MKDIWDSLVRTLTPIIAGTIIGWFASAGITVDPSFEPSLVAGVTAAASVIYYAAARLLEVYVSPKFGWLLLLPKAPEYTGAAN